MYVLGHDHVAENCDPVPSAHIFQRIFEKRASRGVTEKRPPLIAAECKKMQIAALPISMKTGRHDAQAYVRLTTESCGVRHSSLPGLQNRETWGTHSGSVNDEISNTVGMKG